MPLVSSSCHHGCHLKISICLLFLALSSRAQEAESIPHVDECNLCFKCIVDSPTKHWESSFDHAGGGFQPSDVIDTTARKLLGSSHETRRSLQAVKRLPKPPKAPRPPESPDPFEDPKQPPWLRASAYLIKGAPDKIKLPNCTACRGCSTELSFMAETTQFFDRTFTNEKGATSGS